MENTPLALKVHFTSADITCSICYNFFTNPYVLACKGLGKHVLCKRCYIANNQQCPLCCMPSPRAAPNIFMKSVIDTIPIQQECGALVAPAQYREHAKNCNACLLGEVEEHNTYIDRLETLLAKNKLELNTYQTYWEQTSSDTNSENSVISE